MATPPILKLMQIMHEKGHLARQKSGKLHLYKAIASQENTQQQLLDKMDRHGVQGSAAELVMSALGNRKSSKVELKAIREYLDQLEKGEKMISTNLSAEHRMDSHPLIVARTGNFVVLKIAVRLTDRSDL